MQDLKPGEKVRLSYRDVEMTIESVDGSQTTCRWFEDVPEKNDKKLCRGVFGTRHLVRVTVEKVANLPEPEASE